MTLKLTEALKGIPVAVFVNPGAARRIFSESDLDQLLRLWKRQGAEIGNHTATHPDLNKVPLAEYQADILLAEPALRRVRNGKPSRYFRHPFLHTGPNAEVKSGLSKFLEEHHF
jgi:peptidoglycan/xylan/chitin deacetylase (PgdA/CDA1 family)